MTPSNWLWLYSLLAGAVIGSFVVTFAMRSARGEQGISGRSACDACGASLDWYRTLPILSYVAQRGRCANCNAKIPALHLVGEVAGVTIAASAVWAADSIVQAILIALIGFVLLGAAVFDWLDRRLPNRATLAVAVLSTGLAIGQGGQVLIIGALAALVAGALLEGVRRVYAAKRGKTGLGLGDIKLVAALAIWLGFATPWAITLAGVLGLVQVAVLRPVDGKIAFGPALAIAGFAIGIAGERGLWQSGL